MPLSLSRERPPPLQVPYFIKGGVELNRAFFKGGTSSRGNDILEFPKNISNWGLAAQSGS